MVLAQRALTIAIGVGAGLPGWAALTRFLARPPWPSDVTVGPGKGGKAIFHLAETDERSSAFAKQHVFYCPATLCS